MKSFKALMFLTVAAALSCGANGSPTNVTTDDYPKKPSPVVLKGIMDSLQDIANVYFKKYGTGPQFTKEYVNRLAWVRPYNYVVSYIDNAGSNSNFDGTEGQDWETKYIYWGTGSGGKALPSYEVVVGGSGTFTRKGKGGYENWAWNGFVVKHQDMKSNTLAFVKPPTGRQAEGGGD